MAGANLYIRVNGINITHLKVRREMVDGKPVGKRQIVVTDPVFGSFAIDDNEELQPGMSRFILELKDISIPPEQRRDMESRGWRTVNIDELLSVLEGIGALEG